MGAQKLLQKEFSLGNFLHSIHIGILFINEKYEIKSPNTACCSLFGYTADELEQKTFISLLSDKSKITFREVFNNLVEESRNVDSDVFELKVVNAKNEIVVVELNINSTLTASDQLYIIVVNDISRRKKLEKEIKSQIEDKEGIQEELEKIQELSELKSRFVTMASHEFRTPLAGVLSSLNLVQRYLDAEEKSGIIFEHKGKIENHFNKIRESVGNLTRILNEFLSLGKLEEGKVICQWEMVDLKALVSSLPEDFQRLCKTNQKVRTYIKIKNGVYSLDAGMIRNILNNLISNAIKYSGPDSEITVTLGELNSQISLEVRDQGQGIPIEDQSKLFGRFFRAKNATNIQGTGLGLNIVKKYVEMMGGTITFESEVNKGSNFNVLIPAKR